MGLCAPLESRDAVVDQFGFRVGVVGEFGLLASEGETLQEMCGALLVENGKAGESLVEVMLVHVGDVGTLGFDQLKSSITKSLVSTNQRSEIGVHLGGYE